MDDYRIRSYHRAWKPDRMMHSLGSIRLPRPVPLRGIYYGIGFLVLSLLAAHMVIIRDIYDLPTWMQMLLPIGLAALFTLARVQGRYFHSELWARLRSVGMPRWLSGCYWPCDENDEWLQMGRIRLIGEK